MSNRSRAVFRVRPNGSSGLRGQPVFPEKYASTIVSGRAEPMYRYRLMNGHGPRKLQGSALPRPACQENRALPESGKKQAGGRWNRYAGRRSRQALRVFSRSSGSMGEDMGHLGNDQGRRGKSYRRGGAGYTENHAVLQCPGYGPGKQS